MHFVDRAFYKFCNFIEILKIEATSTATFISIESTYIYWLGKFDPTDSYVSIDNIRLNQY
jgi:hypothetical protein